MKTAMTQPAHRAVKPDGEPRMKVILKHKSNIKGSEGRPGQVVEVTTELGKRWIEEKAAEATKDPVTEAELRAGSPERKALIGESSGGMTTANTPSALKSK